MDEITPWWTVNGVWPETQERFCEYYQALTARVAEDLAQLDAREKHGELWVTGVFSGKQHAADAEYATFVDPDRQPEAS